jgi:hypothetical protein
MPFNLPDAPKATVFKLLISDDVTDFKKSSTIYPDHLLTNSIIAKPSRIGYSGIGYSGIDYSGIDYSGIDYSRIDYSGIGYSGIGFSGIGYSE